MPNITIRDIPEDVVQKLTEEAEKRGQSREQFLRDTLKQATEQPDRSFFSNESIAQQVQTRTQFYGELPLEEQSWRLQERIEKDLGRYFLALDETLRELKFTRNEALMMCDICNGTLFYLDGFALSSIPTILYAEIHDGIQLDQADKKWSVDGKAFLERLKSFTPLQALAVVDAIERFWTESNYTITDTDKKLIEVGLVRESRSKLNPEDLQ